MKWKYKQSTALREGDIKICVSFAWIPTKCDDGYIRWLEIIVHQYKLTRIIRHYDHIEESYLEWRLVATYEHDKEFGDRPPWPYRLGSFFNGT
jgi:hypothetical protein